MDEMSKKVLEYRAAIVDLLSACEQLDDQMGWDGERAYVRYPDEKRFDEARKGAARIAEPVAGETPDTTRNQLLALVRACGEFTARFHDDVGRRRAYVDEKDEDPWKAARREASLFLRTSA